LQDRLGRSTGDIYNAARIDEGLSAIRQEFLDRNFLNTRVEATRQYDPATNTVRLAVDIRPGEQTVIDTGNEISEEEVRNLVPIFEEGDFDPDLIREGRARIIEYLQQEGYFEASVDGPEIIPATAESPTRVVFLITKGDRHSVKSVEFRGNTYFTADQLQGRIKIRPATFPRFLNHGLFSGEFADSDEATIRNMYRRAGYDAAFVEVRNEDAPDHQITVVFDITENQRYQVEHMVFTGNSNMPEADLRQAITLNEGDPYSPEEVENARRALTGLYYAAGYPDVRIDVTADRDADSLGWLLTYRISEGRRYRIGEIVIAGNTRTADKFIRRTSGLEAYTSWYDPEKILAAQQRLYATGLFRHVDIVPLDRDTGEIRTLLIQIEEAKHITVTPSVGVKEYTGARVTLDIVHNNVFGGNRALGFRFRWGVHESQFQTTYHEPRLFNHESLDGYGILTAETTNRPQYESSGVELALQVQKRLSALKRLLFTASYQTVDLRDVKVNPIVRLFPDEEGIIQIARLGTSFVSDSRDDALDPRRGVFSTSTLQIANRRWGSEVNFLGLSNQTTYQTRYGTGTLAFSSRIGYKIPYGDTLELPITERYFAGGSTTLRGFGLDEAGPAGGGQLLTIGNAEYRVPFKSFSIGELGGALFYDTGNVFVRPGLFALKDFTHSAGLGLRFKTPLGPVRFDVGFNLFPKTRIDENGVPVREERTHYFFTLGHTF
jgi:outer membrane protein assembly complex protein YaeT